MKLGHYEIFLPLMYNDGSLIEPEKYKQTLDDLINQFGAVTLDSVPVTGCWVYKGVLYRDELLRYRFDIDIAEDSKARKFFEEYKEVLKERFRQIDIYITVIDIEVI